MTSVVKRGVGDSRVVRSRPLARILAAAVVLTALLLVGHRAVHLVPSFVTRVDALGAWGAVVFILGYCVAVVALIPASILTLAAGTIFGLARGTAFTLLGATLGSSAAFLIARHLARSAVERRIAGDPRFAAIDGAIGDRGLWIVFLLRLSPVFPFSLLNYALGLTRVRFRDYLLASAGMIPGTILYVYAGRLTGDAAAVAGGAQIEGGPGRWILTGAGLIATVLVTAMVTRISRRALERRTSEPEKRRLDGPAI